MRRRTIARAGLTAALSVGVLMGMATLTPAVAATGGSGPYPADWSTSSSLPNHTIYRPNSLPSQRLPIVAWSNGACSADGTSAANFLREIASHGFLVISNGNPGGGGSSTSSWLTQSIDWAVAENSRPQSALYNRLDTSKIGVAGFSCGGLEAYAVSGDPRVTTTGIFSSGLLNDANDYQLRRLDHPIAYIVGGPSDIAYPNAIDDWGKLPSGLPAFMGNLNVGHGGTYHQTNGGEFGRAAQLWFRWQLKGDTTAGRAFVGPNCGLCGTAWSVQQKNLTLGSDPTPTPTPTQPSGSIDTNAWYVLVNRNSGKALDVYNLSTADGAPIKQWARNNGNQQQWQFTSVGNGYYKVKSRLSGKVLDVTAKSTADGAIIEQWTDNGGTNQQFSIQTIDGYIQLIARNSGKAVEVSGASTADGGNVVQYSDWNGSNQQWQLAKVG